MQAVLGALGAVMVVGSAAAQPADNCAGPIAQYQVRYAGEDVFEVEASFARPISRLDLAHFPLEARPEGQAASVHALHAYAADGSSVAIAYVGEGGWETGDDAATRITYQLHADHGEVDWGMGGPGKEEVGDYFDQSYVFAGHAFFLIDWGAPRCPVEIGFDLPEGWLVTSPWPVENGTHHVGEYWSLGQNVFAMGQDAPQHSRVGGLDLTWLMDQRLLLIRDEVETILSDLPAAYTELWGAAPGDRFNVFFMTDYMSDGGAFYDSFALRIALPLSPADEISWSHTLAHEVMHIWNDLGKGPEGNVPELEWVNEGFTDYLTLKMRGRTGQLDSDILEQRIANLIRRYRLSEHLDPGLTIAEAGRDKSSNWHLIYGGGALAAFFIDAELSGTDPDRFGEVLRILREERGAGYTYESFMQVLDRETDGLGSEVVNWLDSRPGNVELVKRFNRYGLDVSLFAVDEAYVRFPSCGEDRCPPAFLAAD